MSLPVYVSLARNLCSALNSLPEELFPFLWKRPFINTLEAPYSGITWINIIQAATQAGAIVFMCGSGFDDLKMGYGCHKRYTQFLKMLDRMALADADPPSALTVLRQSIVADIDAASERYKSGFFGFITGACYFFLVLNSLKIYIPSHPKPMIDALIVMEIALLFFLYLMLRNFKKKYTDSGKLDAIGNSIDPKSSEDLNRNLLLAACDSGFDDNLMDLLKITNPSFSLQYRTAQRVSPATLQRDINALTTILKVNPPSNESIQKSSISLLGDNFEQEADSPQAPPAAAAKQPKKKKKKGKSVAVAAVTSSVAASSTATAGSKAIQLLGINQSVQENLRLEARRSYYSSVYELIYFVLNFVAWYGYLMGIATYYFPAEYLERTFADDSTAAAYPSLLKGFQMFLLYLDHPSADWYGNFVGDVMWTIEPILILTSGIVLQHLLAEKRLGKAAIKVAPAVSKTKKNQ